MSEHSAGRRSWSVLLVLSTLVAGVAVQAGPGRPGLQERRHSGLGAHGGRLAKSATFAGASGAAVQEPDKPFSLERAQDLVFRIQQLSSLGSALADRDSAAKAASLLPAFEAALSQFALGKLSDDQVKALAEQETEIESLEGIALKGLHQAAAYRPDEWPAKLPEGVTPSTNPEDWQAVPEGTSKINTGWILDQHLFDPSTGVTGNFPTLVSDYKHYDEGQNDFVMGHYDLSASPYLFGYVWQAQTIYWTDTTTVGNHPNASYCIAIMVSTDGGASWLLYEILYDPETTTSKDMINPKMTMDITYSSGAYTYDRYFVAYEYCYSSTDHDIYVYSDNSELPFYDNTAGGTSDPQTANIAVTTYSEINPAIASDYKTTETSYRLVAYEYAASATDHDIYASQSTGHTSAMTWTTAVSVAATTGFESHPALAAGASGGSVFTSYMHLAYNYDTYTASGVQLLLNPGFESGNNGNWTVRAAGDINCGGGYQRTGTCCAWIGGIVNYPTWPGDWIYQAVTIPPGVQTSTLTFYLKITTNDSTTVPYDYFYADIRDTSGILIQNLVTLSNADVGTYGSYALLTFDLSAYRGQTVRLYLWATNDATLTTSFFVDDTAINDGVYNTDSEVRYCKATHPGTAYPTTLASATKITVLANTGGTTAWPYGPPAVAATHGGGVSPLTYTGSRILVSADQFFPQNQPTSGDPARYQVNYAVNMCNGSTTCTAIPGCSPSLSSNWVAYYIYDNKADYRFPALTLDGVGWIASTGYPQNGVTGGGSSTGYPLYWNSEIYLAYYIRPIGSSLPYGDVVMIMLDASDESCTGFQYGTIYQFTAVDQASDGDGRVVAKQGTLGAFNYFYGWPGVCFNKRLNHLGASLNDDVYFTTLGDDYTFNTTFQGAHIDAALTFNSTDFFGPVTFAWPAGFELTISAAKSAADSNRYYSFSMWDTGSGSPDLPVDTAYYAPGGQVCVFDLCQGTTINALYSGCLLAPVEVAGVHIAKVNATTLNLSWSASSQTGDFPSYVIYRSEYATSASYYTQVGTTTTTSYQDAVAFAPTYYYIVVALCGTNYGPWGAYGQ
jgi:hypothetical protein